MTNGFDRKDVLEKLLKNVAVVRENETMAGHTTFRCGGSAALYARPAGLSELCFCVQTVRELGIPAVFIGNGSNVLFTDAGYDGCVVQIAEGLGTADFDGDTVTAGSGILLSALASKALDRGLAGLEFASGIPGSLGGAVFMNAGAYGGQMADVIESVSSVTMEGELRERPVSELELAYRHSVFMDNAEIITGAKLRLREGEKSDIEARMADFTERRRTK